MGRQQDLKEMYDDAETAFAPEGVAAGNDALSVIFGSPDVSQAVVGSGAEVFRSQFGYFEEDAAGACGGSRLRTHAKQIYWNVHGAQFAGCFRWQSR